MTPSPALRIAPPEFFADPALQAVLRALPNARVVGGAVRDTLAGRSVSEIDLATPWQPDQVMRALATAGIRSIPTGITHGTVTALANRHTFEVTTLRRDVETDGRHARVAFTDDWRADAARRDFTMNALSMTSDGAIYDYFGGIADLHAGRVRFVGDAATRISEDYLRILRFFRFFARYGREAPDAATRAAISAGASELHRLSVERVWSEFSRLLASPDPRTALQLMAELDVLGAVVAEPIDRARFDRLVASGAPEDPILRLAALLADDHSGFAERLKLSTADRERLSRLHEPPVPQPGQDCAELRRQLADTENSILIDRTWLAGGAADGWPALREKLRALPRPIFPLEGRNVLALGVPQGPRVGVLLRGLRQWWLDGGCVADTRACQAELVRRLGG